jgi:uncharacterized membrane protein YjjP (DUF1212 family)
MDDPTIRHHGNPYYFNAGEITAGVLIGVWTVTIALVFYQAILSVINIFGNDWQASWIAFVIVLLVGLVFIILLYHSKRHLMRLAHKFRLLHSAI